MPGIILHLLAGSGMFLVGEFYFHYKSKDTHPLSDHVLLLGVTLFFSLIPDVFLGLYYVFNMYSKTVLMEHHIFLHTIITPLSIVGLLILKYVVNTKREPIWIMGFICILLHVTMDAFFPKTGLWI